MRPPAHALGVQDKAHLYFLTEYLEGGELWDELRLGPYLVGMCPDRARFYAAQLLVALHHAHSRGVVHRWVGPRERARAHARPRARAPRAPSSPSATLRRRM